MRTKTPAMPACTRKRKAMELPSDVTQPFPVELKGDATLMATASIPAPGEECMISLGGMDEPPDFLQGLTFSLERPGHSKLTLPCKHGFGAMNLIYHMARNGMTCPACRHGDPGLLSPDCIPAHFRALVADKVRADHTEESAEADAEHQRMAFQLWQEAVSSDIRLYMRTHAVTALIVGYEGTGSQRPRLTLEFQLDFSSSSAGALLFTLSRYDSRRLTGLLQMMPWVDTFGLAVGTRGYDESVVYLEESLKFQIPRPTPPSLTLVSENSTFEIGFLHQERTPVVESFAWRVEPDRLARMIDGSLPAHALQTPL